MAATWHSVVTALLLALHPANAAPDPHTVAGHHALSLTGPPQQGPDVERFARANPDAPRGGRIRAMALRTGRVLRWGHYPVPRLHSPFDRVAMWDMYERPSRLPARGAAFLQVWWLDRAKAEKLSETRVRRMARNTRGIG